MNNLTLSILVILVFSCSVLASDKPVGAQAEVTKLLLAIASDDHATFVADGNIAFRGLSKDQFQAAVSQLTTKLKDGYDMTYLGDLNQRGYQVTLWRIRIKSSRDDLLATLSMKDGKVGGFWIK